MTATTVQWYLHSKMIGEKNNKKGDNRPKRRGAKEIGGE